MNILPLTCPDGVPAHRLGWGHSGQSREDSSPNLWRRGFEPRHKMVTQTARMMLYLTVRVVHSMHIKHAQGRELLPSPPEFPANSTSAASVITRSVGWGQRGSAAEEYSVSSRGAHFTSFDPGGKWDPHYLDVRPELRMRGGLSSASLAQQPVSQNGHG
ncbi:hypothetical protein RRG08_059731 [Elysia crispata]|uniref:Uncharacterized protein n=1 Tax=Elysia crispata TaxID=231223 RepID=A0AAE1D2J6_9GAST|nr:hypothetical protein RRG08_059731 [Elysia crispata]